MKRRDRSVNRRARPAAHRALAVRRPRNFQVGQSDQWLLSCRHGVVHVGGVGGEHPVCGDTARVWCLTGGFEVAKHGGAIGFCRFRV